MKGSDMQLAMPDIRRNHKLHRDFDAGSEAEMTGMEERNTDPPIFACSSPIKNDHRGLTIFRTLFGLEA
jgi:hypothetical protein